MQPPAGIDASCQLLSTWLQFGFWKIEGFINPYVVSHEKSADVHKSMPMVYFGSYMYRSVALADPGMIFRGTTMCLWYGISCIVTLLLNKILKVLKHSTLLLATLGGHGLNGPTLDYRFQGLLFNINLIFRVNFQLFLFMATVKFYKTICRFTFFNLPIDHYKLISPFSIEFIRMQLRLQYVSIMMHCELSFTGTREIFELN